MPPVQEVKERAAAQSPTGPPLGATALGMGAGGAVAPDAAAGAGEKEEGATVPTEDEHVVEGAAQIVEEISRGRFGVRPLPVMRTESPIEVMQYPQPAAAAGAPTQRPIAQQARRAVELSGDALAGLNLIVEQQGQSPPPAPSLGPGPEGCKQQ